MFVAQPREADRMLVMRNYDKKMDHFTKGLQNQQWANHNTIESITEKEPP